MNIGAVAGHKVVFVHPDAGYSPDQENGRRYLKVGQVYTIKRIKVHRASTDVWLNEVPKVSFNSVMFEDALSDDRGWLDHRTGRPVFTKGPKCHHLWVKCEVVYRETHPGDGISKEVSEKVIAAYTECARCKEVKKADG